MKHKFRGKKSLNSSYTLLDIELFPDSKMESEAIKQVEAMEATHDQKELVENYLLFGLNSPYSVVSIERQSGNRFILKATLH